MRLFHRTREEASTSILRDGFKDRADPTGTNLGFYDQIPEIRAVWFNDVPLDGYEGRLLLLEIQMKSSSNWTPLSVWGYGGAVPCHTSADIALTFQKSMKDSP